jgi:ribosome biogenesis GTPase
LVDTNDLKIQCSILGKQDIVVGDSVNLEYQNKNDPRSALITSRIERTSELKKKSIRGSKVIAANITHVGILLVQNPTTSTEFIDKWIASSKASNIEPFIINNKIDIDMPSAYLEKVEIYKNIDIEIFNISAKENTGLIDLTDYLQNKCTIFVGNSGAGKSTLTSKITGVDIKTKALSNNQGRHTTSISSLYMLPENLEIIDSPGVRDVPIEGLTKEEIVYGFFEIYEASKLCKFSNCNHRGDEGCNVIPMINDGEISKSRYNNFIKFLEQIPDE